MTEARWISASARFVERYLRLVASTIRTTLIIEGRLDDAGTEAISDLTPTLASVLSSRSILLPFWNAHSMLLVSAYLTSRFYRATKRFEAAADDSLGGRITQALFERINLPGRRLSITSPEQRLEDLREILSSRPNLIIAADSYGPYRAISSGMARIARSYLGNVRPLSAVCDRSFPIFRRIRMSIPLPKANIVVGIGPTLGQLALGRPLPEVRAGLANSLASLEINLRPLLAVGSSRTE